MSKPTEVTLKKGEQKKVLRAMKKTSNARSIAEVLSLPRRQVMYFLETEGLKTYSPQSYA